jgi:hypothetical protein
MGGSIPWIVQSSPTAPRFADDVTCRPFLNQIAAVPPEVSRNDDLDVIGQKWRRVVMHQPGSTFQLPDDGIERTVGVLRRTEITQACVCLAGEAF